MKHILITGCSSGFGFDAAKYLAEKGHAVYATMRNVETKNAGSAKALTDFAAEKGLTLQVLELDVVNDESVAAAVAQIPQIDVLINNAGLGFGGAIEAFSSSQVLSQLDLNIVGTIRVGNAVLPKMREQGSGLIIQVSSIAGRSAFPGFGVYNASKWGLEGLSEAWRYELAPFGIDVVLVEPGPFATKFLHNIVPAEGELGEAYKHVADFSDGFVQNLTKLFEDDNAPTSPMVVVEDFEKLIDMAPGTRPLRTISGIDFGVQAVNDALEPIRKGLAEGMGLSDGPAKA